MSKFIFITGGGAGIGAAIAEIAVARGHRVALFDRAADKVTALAERLGPAATAHVGDVCDETSVESTLDALGDVPDAVMNNAGIVQFTPLIDITAEDFRRIMDIDLNGAFIVARAAARRMIPRGSGSIINITSTGGIMVSPGTNAYAPAKAGLAALSKLMALEWGPLGVRVNALAPGMIDGGVSEPIYRDAKVRETRAGAVPLRRLGTTEDIANAALFLASDEAAYVNGHQMVVDGGLTQSVMSLIPRAY